MGGVYIFIIVIIYFFVTYVYISSMQMSRVAMQGKCDMEL